MSEFCDKQGSQFVLFSERLAQLTARRPAFRTFAHVWAEGVPLLRGVPLLQGVPLPWGVLLPRRTHSPEKMRP